MSFFRAASTVTFLFLCFALCPLEGEKGKGRREKTEGTPLFNGVDLEGWRHIGGGKAAVQDGCIVLEHDEDRRSGYLVSKVAARDFQLKFRCKVVAGDSGLLFRSRSDPRTPTEMVGPQFQLNMLPGRNLGGVYELQGRGWVCKPQPGITAQLIRETDWLECEVTAKGDHIRAAVNGIVTADFKDPPPDNRFFKRGNFALQIHGGGDCRAVFKEMAVQVLD